MKYKYRNIKEIPEELRPREKLEKVGAQNLSDEELLAVILGTGNRNLDVLSLSREILKVGWKRLENISFEELKNQRGLGRVKALQIKALIELSKRIREPYRETVILSPKEAYEFLKDKFDERRETLVAVYLDLSHRVMDLETVAIGSLNRVYAQPKDVLRRAVELSAYGVLIAHNHPQGKAEPSQGDLEFTKRLKIACDILGLELVDHIVVDNTGYFSMRERGLIL